MWSFVVAVGALLALPPAPQVPAPPPPGPGRYVARILDRDDGLPDLNVMAVARSGDGFLWIGTREGLVSFDGVRFVPLPPGEASLIPDPWINGLTVDADDRLWIATAAGLAVREHGRVRRIAASQIPAVDVWRALTDRHGRVWVATERGVFRGDGTSFQPVAGLEGFTYTLAEDPQGRIWVAGRNVLALVDGDRIVDVLSALRLRGRIFDVLIEDASHVWIAMADGARRLAVGAGGTVRVDRVVDTRRGKAERPVWALARDTDGALLLGSSVDGVLRVGSGALEPLSPQPHETWSIVRDAFGVLWAGTDQGLARFEQTSLELVRDGLPASAVWSARVDVRGGLWTGMGDGSVYRWSGRRFERVLAGREGTFLSPATWPDGDGLLVAQVGRPLVRVTAGGRAVPLPGETRRMGDVLGLLPDSRGNLWISADSGLFRRTPVGDVLAADTSLGLRRGTRPRAMAEGPDGRLWFGRPWLTIVEPNGVRRLARAEGLSDSIVRVILPRSDVTWVGTADSGLFAVLPPRVIALRHLHRVLADAVLAIAEDGAGHVWVVGAYEMVRIDRQALLDAAAGRRSSVPVRTFDVTDGLPKASFLGDFQSMISLDANGRLLLPNTNGVVRVDPRALPRDPAPPSVLLTAVSVNGEAVPATGDLRLPARVARLEFSLAAPASARPRRVRLQVRLVGADSVWRDLGTRRDVSFGPLPGGAYVFEARAASEDGPWPTVPLMVRVRVARALVEQPWFVPLLLALTAGLVLAIARGRQRLLERELARRQALEAALVRAQKLEGLGRLAGGVAHEINNGMTSVIGFTELAMAGVGDRPEVRDDLTQARRAGDRVISVSRQLLTFARQANAERRVVDLGGIVQALERQLSDLAGSSCPIRLDAPIGRTPILADASQVEQVVVNLVANARDAMPEGGTIELAVTPTIDARPPHDALGASPDGAAPDAWAVLTVRDRGVGMSPEVRQRLFEPFFTTKPVDRGTGLGLSVCHGIVAQHGGAIAIDSAPERGTTVTVWWPLAHASALPVPDTVPRPAPAPDGRSTLLLVDDNAGVRESARRVLEIAGYHVVEAADGPEALAALDDRGRDVDVVITDVVMPGMSGVELAEAVLRRPEAPPVLFMTGHLGDVASDGPPLETRGPVLRKPFTPQELLDAVHQILSPQSTPAA